MYDALTLTTRNDLADGIAGVGVDARNIDGLNTAECAERRNSAGDVTRPAVVLSDCNEGQINNFLDNAEWLSISANAPITGLSLVLFGPTERIRIIGSNSQPFIGSTGWKDIVTGNSIKPISGVSGGLLELSFGETPFQFVSVFAGEGNQFDGNGRALTDGVRLRDVSVVPAPTTLAALGLGLVLLGTRRRRAT